MPNTPIHGLTYPLGSLPLNQIDSAMQVLAEQLDGILPKSGTTTVTTDAQGNAFIPHGMGLVPARAIGNVNGSSIHTCNPVSSVFTNTHICFVVVVAASGTRLANTSTTIAWAAWK